MKFNFLHSMSALMVISASLSAATTTTTFDYTTTGHFIQGTEVGSSTPFTPNYSNNDTNISWGEGTSKSSLWLTAEAGSIETNGTHGEFGKLTHSNHPIWPPSLLQVDVSWTLDVVDQNDSNVHFSKTWTYTIHNWETTNSENDNNPCPRRTVGIVTNPADGHQYLGDGLSESVCDDAHNFGETGDGSYEEKYLWNDTANHKIYEIQISGFYDEQHKLKSTFWAAENSTTTGHAEFSITEKGPDSETIGDRVWVDLNNNGIQDPTELKGAAGIEVKLYAVGNSNPVQEVTTDANGNYHFVNVPKFQTGTTTLQEYYIQFVCPPNVQAEFTLKNAGGAATPAESDTDSDVNPATGKTDNFTLAIADESIDTIDAGIKCGAIGDLVWVDSNDDGIQDPGEKGLPGVQVKLFSAEDDTTPLMSTVTNDLGQYLFTINKSGTYVVEFVLPDGYMFSPANQGADRSKDSDADETTGQTPEINIVLEPGTENHYRNWDAGMVGNEPDDELPTIGEHTTPTVNVTAPSADDRGPDCLCNDVKSDSSDAMGTPGMLAMMLMTLFAALFFILREEYGTIKK